MFRMKHYREIMQIRWSQKVIVPQNKLYATVQPKQNILQAVI